MNFLNPEVRKHIGIFFTWLSKGSLTHTLLPNLAFFPLALAIWFVFTVKHDSGILSFSKYRQGKGKKALSCKSGSFSSISHDPKM